MNAKPVLNHCRALQIAARCFSLGANAPIVERITGISRYTLCGMFFSADDQDCSRRLNIDPLCRFNIDPGPGTAF
jgi:hypothetical protein